MARKGCLRIADRRPLQLGLSAEALATIATGREVKGGWDWAHVNAASRIPVNTGHTDPRFRPGNVMISCCNLNTIVVVDRESKKTVWRAGITIGQDNVHAGRCNAEKSGHPIRIFEVTPAGEIVWEFVNPFFQREWRYP
jgi:hypothetical protein